MTTHPEGRIEVRRVVESGNEVWVQNRYTSNAIEMEAVVIYEIDPTTDTILVGHYYSEEVDRGGPEINAWIETLNRGQRRSRSCRRRETGWTSCGSV
jgi:hypothetical protein